MTDAAAAGGASVEELDRRFVFHPFTQLDEHERVGSPTLIVEGIHSFPTRRSSDLDRKSVV